jgi:hypothetical protein
MPAALHRSKSLLPDHSSISAQRCTGTLSLAMASICQTGVVALLEGGAVALPDPASPCKLARQHQDTTASTLY